MGQRRRRQPAASRCPSSHPTGDADGGNPAEAGVDLRRGDIMTATTTHKTGSTRETAISEHGLIGDLQTAALVTTDGSIDWFCCPRFDSPSVFGSLLDIGRGGEFRIAPTVEGYKSRQLYFPDSAVLITRFMSEEGVGELIDF